LAVVLFKETNGLTLFKFASFPDDGFVHGISTRRGGVSPPPYDSLNLSMSVRDEPERVTENRRRLTRALEADSARLVSTRQVHGDDVLVVTDDFSPDAPLVAADVQVTGRPGWLLTLRFADCVPLLMVHQARRAVAVVHAGWRGTLKGAATAAIVALRERFGADPGGLLVGIGPAVGPCCYEVGEEVARQFADRSASISRERGARPRLDLLALNRQTVIAAGVPPAQIEIVDLCTSCRVDLFFSHRAQGFPAGRFCAAIGLK
jgi:YfiH family protein